MSITDILTEKDVRASGGQELGGSDTYAKVLDDVREWVTSHHPEDLNALIDDPAAKEALHSHIYEYIMQNGVKIEGMDAELLEDRIYHNMAGVTKFLRDLLNDPDVEEVDVNAKNDIDIIRTSTGMSKSPEHFTSEQEAVDIIKKMTRQGRHVIDMGKPMADSYYTRGTRISALVSPVLDDDVGVACSIRKQTKQNVTREKYLQWGTATERELDFITDCTNYGIPIIFAGATGTGKTTDIQFAASTIPLGKRIFVIEETRELNLVRYDLEGNIISSVIHTKTRQSDNKDMVITENDLLKEALRFTPKYIIPAEMRGMEAYTALKAAQTGHTVITSIHAESAKNAYYRVLCLCRENPEAQTFTDAMLYRMIAEAFPLVVFKHQLADGSRKIIEIVEAAGFEKEEIIFKTLFSYEIVENVYDKNDVLKEIKGRHVLGSPVSSRIIEKMRFGGASNKVLARYIKEVENQ